jgi:hypothetical protein
MYYSNRAEVGKKESVCYMEHCVIDGQFYVSWTGHDAYYQSK